LIILTEKPSVAKDFAVALDCRFSPKEKFYASPDGKILITNCVGHLFRLAEPTAYDPSFKYWTNLPVIPKQFIYEPVQSLKSLSDFVVSLLKNHKKDEILIATDADREGEIIARECLAQAEITDFSKIRRFWVSQALTKDVILDGIKNAKPVADYDGLSEQGFARQKADWLIGINASRYVSNIAKSTFPVGRVQTAILSEIADRCNKIQNFKSEKYFEGEATFNAPDGTSSLEALLIEDGNTAFKNKTGIKILTSLTGKSATVSDVKKEKRTINPPQLYNLNDLQKDAFAYFGYSADKTLSLVQTLYEKYKCVSYPRTPSKVMGSDNVNLCRKLHDQMIRNFPEYFDLHSVVTIDGANKRVFDDSKLEAHHALIPLSKLPANASGDEENVYFLILERFMLAFAPVAETENMTVTLTVEGNQFTAKGTRTVSEGWKQCRRFTRNFNKKEGGEAQDLSNTDFERLVLKSIEAKEKHTKPQKHYNEASLLSFMENPKNSENQKLAGLGTAATRHTFVPKLKSSGFIEDDGKNLVMTKKGWELLDLLSKTKFNSLADISETTRWEQELSENPANFLEDIKVFIKSAVRNDKTDGGAE